MVFLYEIIFHLYSLIFMGQFGYRKLLYIKAAF